MFTDIIVVARGDNYFNMPSFYVRRHMTAEATSKELHCASCGCIVGEDETELVNNPWSLLFPPRRIPRCGRCLRRRRTFVFWICVFILLVTAVAVIVML